MKHFIALFLLMSMQRSFAMDSALNVIGTSLKKCCDQPKTGYYRNGLCQTGPDDHGTHVACAVVTKEFLEFTRLRGNDLITPRSEWNFPGLKPGDRWCLCALRWLEAKKAGVAPTLDLEATHDKMLDYISLTDLKKYNVK